MILEVKSFAFLLDIILLYVKILEIHIYSHIHI
jgi:hypothetical protein